MRSIARNWLSSVIARSAAIRASSPQATIASSSARSMGMLRVRLAPSAPSASSHFAYGARLTEIGLLGVLAAALAEAWALRRLAVTAERPPVVVLSHDEEETLPLALRDSAVLKASPSAAVKPATRSPIRC